MAVIILAGGLSTRMRRDKASLVLGGSTLLESLIARLSDQFQHFIVVERAGQNLAVSDAIVARDIYDNAGPLGGIHAGLLASPHDVNIVIACDMPFAEPALAHHLVSLLDDHDAVVPLLDRGPEPLFAAYRKSVLPYVEHNLKARSYKMRSLLDSVNTVYVPEDEIRTLDPHLHSFLNVNTPEDYDKLIRGLIA